MKDCFKKEQNKKDNSINLENEKFIGLISISDAAIKYKKNDSTFRKNIQNGIFKEGRDCIKLGNQWIFDESLLDKFYK